MITPAISKQHLVVIDTSIQDYNDLAASAIAAGMELILLSDKDDRVAELAIALSEYRDIESLHLISHGSVGELLLGDISLTSETLSQYSDNLAVIADSLSSEADLLLYGCEIGKNEEGKIFLKELSDILGADIAASDDLTGSDSLGGDWLLEQTFGNIEAATFKFNADWQGVLNGNSIPEITGLDATPPYTENDDFIVLDSDVTLFDAELDSAGSYNGATLTIQRTGGANSADKFYNQYDTDEDLVKVADNQYIYFGYGTDGSIVAYVGTWHSLGVLFPSGQQIGVVTENTNGTFSIEFNSDATTDIINAVAQQIVYQNTSDTPDDTVSLDFTFSDGTDSVTESITVDITPSNDDPIFSRFLDTEQVLGSFASRDLSFSDIDDDGDLDLLVGNSFSYPNRVWFNDGNGNFTDSGQELGNQVSYGIEIADVTGDGLDDFIAVNANGRTNIWFNDGDGTFIDSNQSLGNGDSQNASAADIDGDGDLDLLITTGGIDSVLFNDGSGQFSSGYDLGEGSDTERSAQLADVNDDGLLDLTLAATNELPLEMYYNTGGLILDSSGSLVALVSDTNSDGLEDLTFYSPSTVLENDGSYSFTVKESDWTSSLSSYSGEGAFGDFDGDGDLDIHVGGTQTNTNRIWLNDGSGQYSLEQTINETASSRATAVGDVDGDGDLDILVANFDGANTLWLNDGSANFSDSGQEIGDSGTVSYDVKLVDFDQDGDLDAFVANNDQANALWLNDSSGIFTDSSEVLTSFYDDTNRFALGDIDGDGDDDLAEALFLEGNRIWINTTPVGGFDENTINTNAQKIFDEAMFYDGDAYGANGSDLDGGILTLTGLNASESIVLQNQDVGIVGNIQQSGNDIQISDGSGWTTFAVIDGTLNGQGTGLSITLNTHSTSELVSSLLSQLYYQSSSETGEETHTLTLRATDGDGGDSGDFDFSVTVTAENDLPEISTNIGVTANRGAVVTITSSQLSAADLDHGSSELTYTLTNSTDYGQLWLDSDGSGTINNAESALSVDDHFSQADVLSNLVKYAHDSSTSPSADSFDFTLSDGVNNLSGLFAITLDSPLFALEQDTGVDGDSITSSGVISVSGLPSGASWEYNIKEAGWTNGVGDTFTLSEGTYQIDDVRVRQTDGLGNTTLIDGNEVIIVIDVTDPETLTLDLSADTGNSSSDGITNNRTLNISDLEADASWQYSVDSGSSWSSGSGTSFTLDEGMYAVDQVQVRQTDQAGNISDVTSNDSAIQVDLTNPNTLSLALLADTGSSDSDGITNNDTLTISDPETDASWQYSVDSGNSWTIGSGTSFTLNEGTYGADQVQVRQTDVAGNISDVTSNDSAIQVDLTDPNTLSLALSVDTGSSDSDGITNNNTLTVADLEAGATWQYSVDSGNSWTTGSGTSFTLDEGTYTVDQVQVRQTDVAGNISDITSNDSAIQVDLTAPNTLSLVLLADTGNSGSDRITNNQTLTISDLETDATWQYSVDSGSSWTTGAGTSFTVDEGVYSADQIQVRQTDVAGNISDITDIDSVIQVDLTDPNTLSLALSVDTGSSDSDGITNNNTLTVADLEAGATWQYSVDSGGSWTTGAGTSFTVDEGTYSADQIQVRQTDTAGNISDVTGNDSAIQVDLTDSNTLSLALLADTGNSGSDRITNNQTLTVSDLETDATWQYSIDSGNSWITGSGTSFTVGEGVYSADQIQVRQTDTSGNTSVTVSNDAVIEVDITQPTVLSFNLSEDSGQDATDNITNNIILNISGLEAGANWEYSSDSGVNWINGSGNAFTLSEGTHAVGGIQVRQTDIAGNISDSTSNDAVIEIDVTEPNVLTLTLAEDTGSSDSDHITNNNSLNIIGLEADATWQYSQDSGVSWTDGIGSSFTLMEGVFEAGSVQVRQTDLAGNESALGSNSNSLTIDITAAEVESMIGAWTILEGSAQDTLVNTVSILEVDNAGTLLYSLSSDADGRFYIEEDTGKVRVSEGAVLRYVDIATHYVGVIATDIAGNEGAGAYSIGVTKKDSVVSDGSTTVIDGAEVITTTETTEDGRVVETVTVEPVSPLQNDDGSPGYADIPLQSSDGDEPTSSVSLPAGVGFSAFSDATASENNRLSDFASILEDVASSQEITSLARGSEGFFALLGDNNGGLWVNAMTLTTDSDTPPDLPVVIQGDTDLDSKEALVIDASSLPPGTVIDLKDIDFAVIIGPAILTGGEGANIVYAGDGSQTIVLGEDDDELHGGDGDDTVGSKGGDDLLFGDGGNDTLFGGEGMDTLHGGLDTDLATYEGNKDDYLIEQDNGVVTITRKDDSSDSDTLINIENIQFADQTMSIEYDDDNSILATLYGNILGRQADVSGFQWWASEGDEGTSLGRMVLCMIDSEEYREVNDNFDFLALGQEEQIESLYEILLGRKADYLGKSYWLEQVENGVSMENVAQGLVDSAELTGVYLAKEEWDFIMS